MCWIHFHDIRAIVKFQSFSLVFKFGIPFKWWCAISKHLVKLRCKRTALTETFNDVSFHELGVDEEHPKIQTLPVGRKLWKMFTEVESWGAKLESSAVQLFNIILLLNEYFVFLLLFATYQIHQYEQHLELFLFYFL